MYARTSGIVVAFKLQPSPPSDAHPLLFCNTDGCQRVETHYFISDDGDQDVSYVNLAYKRLWADIGTRLVLGSDKS